MRRDMHLKPSVSYAIGILLRVSELDTPAAADDISEGCDFPRRFLYHVLRRLVKAELLTAKPGVNGGYALTRPLARISLLDVVLALGEADTKDLQPVCPKQKPAIAKTELARVSVGDLVDKPFVELRPRSTRA